MKKNMFIIIIFIEALYSVSLTHFYENTLAIEYTLINDTVLPLESPRFKTQVRNISANAIVIKPGLNMNYYMYHQQTGRIYPGIMIRFDGEPRIDTLYPGDFILNPFHPGTVYEFEFTGNGSSPLSRLPTDSTAYLDPGLWKGKIRISLNWKFLNEKKFTHWIDDSVFFDIFVKKPVGEDYKIFEEIKKKVANAHNLYPGRRGSIGEERRKFFNKSLTEILEKYPHSSFAPIIAFKIKMSNNTKDWMNLIESYPNYSESPVLLRRLIHIKYNILYKEKNIEFFQTYKTIPPLPKEPGWDKEKTVNYLKSLIKRFPGTRIAKRAEEILNEIEEGGK